MRPLVSAFELFLKEDHRNAAGVLRRLGVGVAETVRRIGAGARTQAGDKQDESDLGKAGQGVLGVFALRSFRC